MLDGGDGATGNVHNHTVTKEPKWGDFEQPRHLSVNADTTVSVNNHSAIYWETVLGILDSLCNHNMHHIAVTALPGRQSNAHIRFSDTCLTGESIPVHISFFNDNDTSQFVDCPSRTRRETEDIDDDDFIKYIKKKSKRFYIGGFLPTITREKIEWYV